MAPENAPVRLVSAILEELNYEILENYLYLDSTGQVCLIKPTNYDQQEKTKFRKQFGRIENMGYDPKEDCFICAQGRRLPLRRESSEWIDGQLVTTAWYCCAKDINQPKTLRLRKTC